MEHNKVPGYTRALQRGHRLEESYREYSYLDVSHSISGIAVRPLTLQVYLQLCRADSPFLCGGRAPFIHDVAFFLFRLSPAYDQARAAKVEAFNRPSRKVGRIEAWLVRRFPFLRSWFPDSSSQDERAAVAFKQVRGEFCEHIRSLPFDRTVRAINRFVDRMLLDKPIAPGRGNNPSFDPADTSVAADIIHLIASAYGWKRAEILALPMPEVFQALRKIQRDDPKCHKKYRAKVHPYATRFTRKHRAIARAAALALANLSAPPPLSAVALAKDEPCN